MHLTRTDAHDSDVRDSDAHDSDARDLDAPVTVPLPRTPGMAWPGEGPTAQVPAALLLAARGRCSCADCVDGFVALLRRRRLAAV